MLYSYENDTIASMFYELEAYMLQQNKEQQIRWSNFDMASKYLSEVINGLKSFYDLTNNYFIESHVNNFLNFLKVFDFFSIFKSFIQLENNKDLVENINVTKR